MLPKLLTSLPGPKSKAIIDRDDQVYHLPIQGLLLWLLNEAKVPSFVDPDGNRFLDFAAGIAVVATGHSTPGS